MVLTGLGLAVLYWLLETVVIDVLIFQEGSVTDRLLPLLEEGEGHELYARSLAAALIIASSVAIQILVNRSERTRERLRESEARHRAVVDTAPDAIITMTQAGLIRFFNPGAESIFGYLAEEIVGRPLKILMPERFREAHKKGFRRYLETGEAHLLGKGPVELAGLRKSGEEFPLELTLGEMWQNGGLLFTGIIRDITERRQAEQEIRKLNQELEERIEARTVQLEASVSELEDTLAKHERAVARERLLRNASAALVAAPDRERIYAGTMEAILPFIDEAPGTRVSIWSGSTEKDVCVGAAGHQASEIEGRETRIREFPDRVRTPLLEGRAVDLRPGESTEFREAFGFSTKEGGIFMVPLFVQERFEGRIVVASDSKLLGDIKYGLETLGPQVALALERADLIEDLHQRQSEKRFRSLVQNSSNVVTVYEADGTIRYVSPAIKRVLGYEPEERIGVNEFAIIHPDDVATAKSKFAEALRNPGVPISIEVRVRHRDGSWRHMEAMGTNLLDDPDVEGVVLNSHDVTGRKQAEQEIRQLNEELEERIAERIAELRESEERYALVAKGSNDGIFDWDIRKGGLYWNERHFVLVGLSSAEVTPSFELFSGLLHPEDRQRTLDALEAHLERGESFDSEFRLRHSSGEYRNCHARGEAQRDEHGATIIRHM